jgi:malonyl-CoA decarboxylase
VATAHAAYQAAVGSEAQWDAEAELRAALRSARIRILTQFNAIPQGVKFLVDLRADLLRYHRRRPGLAPLDRELESRLSAWFDVGFLELQRITWNSPAALLEKLIEYEAVHEIRPGRPQEPARLRPPLLRLLPPAHAAGAADLRRGGAAEELADSIQALLDDRGAGVRREPRRHRDLLFDLATQKRLARGELRQLPAQARDRRPASATSPSCATSPRCRRCPAFAAWVREAPVGTGGRRAWNSMPRNSLPVAGPPTPRWRGASTRRWRNSRHAT